MNPKKLQASMTLVGVGHFLIASIYLHQWLPLWQRCQALDRLSASRIDHILKVLVLTLPTPVSARQPRVSQGG